MDSRHGQVLMAVCNYFNPDNRVFRAADTLQKEGYRVTVLAYHKPGLPETEVLGSGFHLRRIKTSLPLIKPGRIANFLMYQLFKHKSRKTARKLRPDFIHAHDYNALFLGKYGKKKYGSKVIYDNHEYFQDLRYLHRYPLPVRKLIAAYERRMLRKYVDRFIVVSPGIRDAYRSMYRGEIHIVRNIPDISEDATQEAHNNYDLRTFLNEQNQLQRKLFLYLGTNTQRGRGLDFLINLLGEIGSEYGLVVLGIKSDSEKETLLKKLKEQHLLERSFIGYSQPITVLKKLSRFFFMGVSLIEPIYFSYLHSLPNKLFEYLHMGLPVLSSDIPDQGELIRKYHCGVVVPFDLQVAKRKIMQFNPDPDAVENAIADLSWDKESKILLDIYEY